MQYETELQRKLTKIEDNNKSFGRRVFGLVASVATNGLFKAYDIPRDLARARKKKRLVKEFKLIQLQASELYYHTGKELGFEGLYKPEHLLTKVEWQSVRSALRMHFQSLLVQPSCVLIP